MPRAKTTLSELRVGILTVATIVILIVFILSVTGDISIFKDSVTFRTRFSAGEGLKAGDEVRLGGKRVGKVESVDFGDVPKSPDEKPIVVTLTVNATEVRDRIRADSKAVLGQQGFLGDRVIDITPGTTAGAVLPPNSEIPSADVTGLAQVFGGANDLLVIFNTVGKQIQELMDNINKGQGTIGKLLHDDQLYVNLNRTVVDAQALVNRMKEGEGTIGKLLNDPAIYNDLRGITDQLKTISTDLSAGKGTAGKLLKDEKLYNDASEAIAKAKTSIEKLDRIVADVEAGRGTIGKLFKDEKLHADLQSTISSVRAISDRLERGEGSAGKFLRDDKLYNNVDQMSAEMVKLLYDFRQNPKKYLSIKVSLF
ncbi:MAG TPA: MlaD family protein [Blastocatellia bacterium]|nr:MlaD family protein [Blastocatellia bacterium]